MNIPLFWSKENAEATGPDGKTIMFKCWGWSSDSLEAAVAMGRKRADVVAEHYAAGTAPDRYAYADRPLREEILSEIAADGAPTALVTRNSYGSQILNTEAAMFVDVDLPQDPTTLSLGGWLRSLFSNAPAVDTSLENEKAALSKLSTVVEQLPTAGVRIYKTRAGLRYLFTHAAFVPDSDEVTELMKAMDADPLYLTLCRAQKCFRARLTPKPWRCRIANPRLSHPRPKASNSQFQKWLATYERASEAFATCRFVAHLGSPSIHPNLLPLVTFHDEMTKAESGLPLA